MAECFPDRYKHKICGAYHLMVTITENRHGNPSSNLDEAVSFSYGTNTLGKGMNSSILSQVIGK